MCLLPLVLSLGTTRSIWFCLYSPHQVFVHIELNCLVVTAVVAPPNIHILNRFFCEINRNNRTSLGFSHLYQEIVISGVQKIPELLVLYCINSAADTRVAEDPP